MKVIDSHTAGEPTRVIVADGPELGSGSLQQRQHLFEAEFDDFRTAAVLEPRGYEAMVGALLCEPDDPTCDAAVIFFNNRGFLKMCGHGSIGLAVTLVYMGKAGMGVCRIQTPVGVIEADIRTPNRVSITNIPCYRYLQEAVITHPEFGKITGQIAWGGNWFFITRPPIALKVENIPKFRQIGDEIKKLLTENGLGGADGEVDHIQFFEPDPSVAQRSKTLVVCPGGEFDRSPCGTGTSALAACLAADGQLAPGETWTQQSVTGGVFTVTYEPIAEARVIPTITGEAYVCSEATLVRHQKDPYRNGRAGS